MKKYFIVIISSFLTFNGSAQWVYQNQVTNELLNTVVFIDSLYGWIGGSNGIILNTNDGGNNWIINSDSSRGQITSFDFINRLNGWAVTSYGKILKTVDGGIHWNLQDSVNTHLYKIDFVNDTVGYICASPTDITLPETILKTTNVGDDWFPIIIPNLETATSAKFIDDNIGYVIGGFPAKIFNTNDGGNNWDIIKIDSILDWYGAIDFKDLNNGLLGGFEWGYLSKTTNGGQNWIDIPLYVRRYQSIIYKGDKIWLLAEGDGPRYIIHSFDNGATWFPQIRSIIGEGILEIFFIDDNLGWAVGNFGKILKTTNGGFDSLITPTKPSLEYPPDNFVFSDNYIWLRWYEIEGSIFRIQIAMDSLFSDNEISLLLPDNNYKRDLLPEKRYFWRLRTENPLGESEWSEARSFTTGKPVNVKNDNNQLTNFYLLQNYPNPFNSSTIMEFSIPFFSYVTLKIYDILGREVRTLISNNLQGGNHKIKLDANDLSSVIYLYQLYFQNNLVSKKFILLK